MLKKESKLKLHLSRQKWTMNVTLIFVKRFPLTFNTVIPTSFYWSEHLSWYGVKMGYRFFNVLYIHKFYA